MNDGSRLEPFLGDLVAGDAARAAVALVGDARGVRSVHAVGTSSDARFDLASLTKPFVATLALVLHQAGELRLDSPLGQVWRRSEASLGPPLEACALELLLRHRSGLAPWAPLYALAKTPERALPLLLAGKLVEPAPAGVAYSDLGYVLWGLTAAESLGAPVEELLERNVSEPLGLTSLGLGRRRPLPGAGGEIVVTSPMDTAKEVVLAAARGLTIELLPPPEPGQPQDGNTRFLGGVPGHAGLFGTARDVWRLGAVWLRALRGEESLLPSDLVRRALGGTGPFALGWARASLDGSSGPELSGTAFGHVGFTGTSLWIDPERDRIAVLLAARTSPLDDFNRHRRSLHDLVFRG